MPKNMFEAPESTHPLAKKFERPEDKLGDLLAEISEKQNEEFRRSPESIPILNSDCSINMAAFGYFDIESDKEKVYQKEREWSGADNPMVQENYYVKDKGQTEGADPGIIEKIIQQNRINRERSASSHWENALVFLLYKIIGERYLIAKSAEYDDYFNGTDTLVVDKETGNVICALDEVHDNEKGDRHIKKIKASETTARHGGAEIKYGITFEKEADAGENKLVKKRLTNVPKFYMRISRSDPETKLDLQNLLANMNYNLNGAPSEIELRVFDSLVDSLAEQRKILAQQKYSRCRAP